MYTFYFILFYIQHWYQHYKYKDDGASPHSGQDISSFPASHAIQSKLTMFARLEALPPPLPSLSLSLPSREENFSFSKQDDERESSSFWYNIYVIFIYDGSRWCTCNTLIIFKKTLCICVYSRRYYSIFFFIIFYIWY